jgi:DNA recombination protein RmuC
LGLRGLKVEESAREILRHLSGLQGQLAKFQDEFRKVGKHLEQSKGSFDSAQRQLEKLSDKLAAMETPPLLQTPEESPKQPFSQS